MRRRGFLLVCLIAVAVMGVLLVWWIGSDRQRAATNQRAAETANPSSPATLPAADPGASSLVAVDTPAPAAGTREEAQNFDRRAEKVDTLRQNALAAGREERRRAAERLQTMVRGVRVDFDETLGVPSSVASSEALLTGPAGEGGAVPPTRMQEFPADDPLRVVKGFVAEHAAMFGHGPAVLADARVTRDYETPHNGMRTVVWQQEVDGVRVFESTFQAHVTKRGELVNVASRMVPDARKAAEAGTPNHAAFRTDTTISPKQAVSAAAATLGEKVAPEKIVESGPPEGAAQKQSFRSAQLLEVGTEFVWLPLDESAMRLCWEVLFVSKARGEMFRTLVDAETGAPLLRQRLTEYISNASYHVFASDSPSPFSPGHPTPSSAQPAVVPRTLVTTMALDTTASPNGWINDGGNETVGNNVDAHSDTNSDNVADTPRPQGSPNRVFDFPLDLAQAPSTYRNAAITDLFYWCNIIHDRFYQLGFTEAAGNFQTNNFGRGGIGNDAVQADAQDGSGTNNANFSTPPDGSAGRVQMFVFDGTTPDRDGSFDHDIVIHEYTHGLSNRLVGGGVGISALQSRGMGEGWSDFYGLALLSEPGDDAAGNYAAGGYATHQLSGMTTNYYFGIRRYPYSTDRTKNPLTFRDIDPAQASPHTGIPLSPRYSSSNFDAAAVHRQGEVWCVTLWEVRANLIARHGFTAGNERTLQLITDGMKLAPANPNFLQARDAILQADLVGNGGADRGALWAGFAKRGMGAGATSPASSTTTAVVESFDIPDDLRVSPTGIYEAGGMVGGPFAPASQTYTLTNNGTAPVSWIASRSQPWLTLTPGENGVLAPGATVTVTATINSAADSLNIGTYTGSIDFTNVTSGLAQARSVRLKIDPITIPIFGETWESGNIGAAWTITGTGTHRTQVATANGPRRGTRHLTMDSSTDAAYARNEATLTFDLAGRRNVQLRFWVKMFSDEPDAPPASPFANGADFDGVAISADGTNWYEVQALRALSGAWQQFVIDLDAAVAARGLSFTSAFKIRFNHYDNYTIPTDGFAFDDIELVEVVNNRLTLALPATAGEGAGTVNGTLSVTPVPAAGMTVSLASSNPAEAFIPDSVTVPPGQATATFPITVSDDALLDGTQTVTITASAPTFVNSTATIGIEDNETASVTLSVPATATEGIADFQGTVTISAPAGKNVTVALASSDPAELQVPAAVVIPAGQTSAVVAMTVVDDNRIDGTTTATLTAHVANWTDATATVSITDNETSNLVVSLPGTVREGDGTAIGSVRISGTLSSPLTVDLTTSDISELTVPGSVIIAAGQTSANFTATVIDDAAADGAQPVTLTAAAPGFPTGSVTVSVADNDADHLTFAAVPSPRIRNAPFPVSISARDVNGAVITNFNSPVNLTAAAAGGALPITPGTLTGWVNGVWSGNVSVAAFATDAVLIADDAQGHTGTSNAFEVTYGPAVSLSWSAISSPQGVDAPFPVMIRAVDTAGNLVPTFTGPTSLAALAPGELPVSPASTGAFAGGEWTGNITIPFTGASVRLRATDGALTGESSAFAVTTAVPPGGAATVFAEDFESGALNPAYWTPTGTNTFRTQVSASYAPHGGTKHLTMDSSVSGSTARNEATLTVNLAGRTGAVLKFWAAGYADEASGPPSSPFTGGADFDGVAISADGTTWWEVQALRSLPSTYAQFTVDLDAAIAARGIAYNSGFKIRFNQYDDFPLTTDGIVIDDILITAAAPAGALTLSLPAQVTEGAGAVSGTVSVSAAPADDLVLNLSSKAAGKITVPATVTIPAGQTSAPLLLTVLDDAYVDGTKNVVITAVAPGYSESGATIQVLDNDGGALTFTLPATVSEDAGTVTGTLSLSRAALVPLTIAITSDNPLAAQPTASVTVPRGDTTATFTVTIPNNGALSGDQTARLTATLNGWTSAVADLLVQDDDPRALTVTIPTAFRETDPPKTGTVTLGGTLASNLVVALASSDSSAVTVPASVTIAAGQTSAPFTIMVQDDLLADGAQPFTITASAATFTAGTASGQVRDNEAHHFTIEPISSPQVANGPVPTIVKARDPLGAVLTDYNSPITLTATSDGGALAVSPASTSGFVNGVWNGSVQINALATNVVLTASDGQGHSGSSNPFDLAAGQIDRFVWDPIASPQALDTPFAATIRAVDPAGGTVPAYNGVAHLFAVVASENAPIGIGTSSLHAVLNTYSHDSRTQIIYSAAEMGGAARIASIAFNIDTASAEPLTNFTIRLKHTTLANYSGAVAWETAGWTTVYRGSPTVPGRGWMVFAFSTPFEYNGTSNLLVDYSMDRATTRSVYTYVVGTDTSTPSVIFATSNSTNGDPLTWAGTTPYPNQYYGRPNVRFATLKEVPIRPPQSGAFSSGVWTGAVSVPIAGSGVSLRARAGAVTGTSSPVDITSSPAPPQGGAVVLTEDFESGTLNPSRWTVTGTGPFRTQVSTAYAPRGMRHLTMDSSTDGTYARNEATLTVNLAARTGVVLKFWAAGHGDEPSGPPTSPFTGDANFDGVAISADGTTWWEVQALRSLPSTYAQFTVDLDAAIAARGIGYSSAFRIRFNQYDDYALTTDGIVIDDILITAAPLAGFGFNTPAQVTEGDGAVNAQVVLDAAASMDAVVALSSSAPAKITVPTSVTVLAGQTTADFLLTVLDDTIVDGDRMVAITGTLAGHLPRGVQVNVRDNETLPLALVAPATVAEGAGVQSGTITIGSAASGPVTVQLSSSDTTEIQVPATVVLQPGQTTASFPITVVNDVELDGTQTATITASVPGWTNATAAVQVTDNEGAALTLSGLFSVYEGVTSSGTVSIGGTLPTNLVVTLTSSNPAQFTVPATATILAGQTSASFIGTAVDDTAHDGTQSVTITATAPNFASVSTTVSAFDNDVHHFAFASIASPQKSGVPFAITVTARDVNNSLIVQFSGLVALSAAAGANVVPLTPTTGTFSSGSWTGSVSCGVPQTNVRLTATGAGATGTSNPFDVQLSPAISLTPASLALSLNQGSSTTRSLTIANTGGGTLTWSIATAAALTAVESEGPAKAGGAPVAKRDDDAAAALEPPDRSRIHAEARPAEDHLESITSVALTSVLTNLNANSGLVRSVIPNRYPFSEGVTGTNINDGGSDMYDGGNYLSTNLGTNLAYSDNVIAASTALGAGGQYFTRKLDGLWVFAADVAGLGHFEITGNLGADGSGTTDSAVLSVVRNGTTYRGFVKRVYAAGDPSVNHLIITADNGSVTHEASTDTNNDYHRVMGLTGVTRLYYLLYAGTGGAYIDNAATLNIMTSFLDAISVPDWIAATPAAGSVAAGASQTTTLTISAENLTQGTYSRTLVISSNDPTRPQASLPVTLEVLGVANLAVTPAAGLTASGLRGGPFTPAAQTFTLTNSGAQPLDWTASKSAPWLDLMPVSGTLNPGATTTVVATLNAGAAGLVPGSFTDTVAFTNTTNGAGTTTRPVALTVLPAGELTVTPAVDFAATGPFGGPFTPGSHAYTLTNTGDAPLSWTATTTSAPWLNLSSSAGTLAAGASTTVAGTVNAAATELGSYSGSVHFVNTSNGRGNTTRAASLTVGLPSPLLVREPEVSGGTSNAVAWNAVFGVEAYEVQASADASFTTPVSSGWIAATSYTFTGLVEGSYHYRVRARRAVPGASGSWTQSSQAEFATNTASAVSTSAVPGSVILAASGVLTENFDAPGTDWSNTIFSDTAGVFSRSPLGSATAYPNTTPPLPINQGGDLEGDVLGSALLPNLPPYQFNDGQIDAYILPARSDSFGYFNAGLYLRARRGASGLNGYVAGLYNYGGTSHVFIDRVVNGIYHTLYPASSSFPVTAGTENFRLRFSASGDRLTATLWRVSISGGVLTETPVLLEGGTNSIVRTDSTYSSGVAGLYGAMGSQSNDALFDDVTVTGPSLGYGTLGTLTTPPITPSPWVRWRQLTFNGDTSPAGTALRIDVLDTNGAELATNLPSGMDLNLISAIASQPSIRLRAQLITTNSANTPRLDDWSLGWQSGPNTTAESAWSSTVPSRQDATPPVVSVTTGRVSTTAPIALEGRAADLSSIAGVAVNGAPAASLDGFLNWSSAPVALVPGWNTFSVAASDRAVPANVTSVAHAIYFATAAGDADKDGLPDTWEMANGLDPFNSAGESGAAADIDHDGLPNLLERAFARDPRAADAGGTVSANSELNPADGLSYLTVRHSRLISRGSLRYIIEVSRDLVNWTSATASGEELEPAVPVGDGVSEIVATRIRPALSEEGNVARYVRVRVIAR